MLPVMPFKFIRTFLELYSKICLEHFLTVRLKLFHQFLQTLDSFFLSVHLNIASTIFSRTLSESFSLFGCFVGFLSHFNLQKSPSIQRIFKIINQRNFLKNFMNVFDNICCEIP